MLSGRRTWALILSSRGCVNREADLGSDTELRSCVIREVDLGSDTELRGCVNREADLGSDTELRSCVKVEVAVQGSRPTKPYGFRGRKVILNHAHASACL